ncbi:MAG: response regulator transcription factor [Synergistaceae bacterium]|nr:response regulator transcription factor [Synergistaceae bacterium]
MMKRTIKQQLTPRELLVLTLVAAGFSDRKIAETLHISIRTVNNYVLDIRAKLNANSRTHATVKALKKGLLSFEEIENYESGISNKK